VESESVAEVFHDVVAPCCESDDDCEAAEGEDPDWDGDGGGYCVCLPDEEDCGEGSDCVGNVI
jgi:hypothetical protein